MWSDGGSSDRFSGSLDSGQAAPRKNSRIMEKLKTRCLGWRLCWGGDGGVGGWLRFLAGSALFCQNPVLAMHCCKDLKQVLKMISGLAC